jgi:hypothetical protein
MNKNLKKYLKKIIIKSDPHAGIRFPIKPTKMIKDKKKYNRKKKHKKSED